MTSPASHELPDRRGFLRSAASATGLLLTGCATARAAHASGGHDEALVTPGEDLMQEHGVLERILLIYDEAARRIEHGEALDLGTLNAAAGIVRRFVEDYHERLEEQFVFPRLQSAGREAELVAILLRQHQRGRALTDDIMRRLTGPSSAELALLLRSFARMYRPHAAREDTVLFPALRAVMGSGYQELGEQFEDKEHELFGEEGFRGVVNEVARIEAALDIGDLATFTP